MDGSIKIYDIEKDGETLKANLFVDSNVMDPSAQPYDAANMDDNAGASQDLDPWKFSFNPKNNSQFITGQLSL